MPVELHELIYDPKKGHDVAHPRKVDFDPSKYTSKEAAAHALYEALVKFAMETEGYSEELARGEIHCWPPERTEQYSGTRAWCVVWESGPFEWAIGMSMQLRGPWGYTEPYYSFDLHFTE